MNRPRFLADEDFIFPLIYAIRRMEPELEMSKVQELGIAGIKDVELLNYSCKHNLILLSHDANTLIDTAQQRILRGEQIPGLFIASQSIPTRVFVEEIRLIWLVSKHQEWIDHIEYLPLK